MPRVTFRDCAAGPMLRFCSAHIANGGREHDKGVDPCVVAGDDEE